MFINPNVTLSRSNDGADMMSTACSNITKKCLEIKKIGHTGTLDSYAEGVLLLAIGRSTKLIPVLLW